MVKKNVVCVKPFLPAPGSNNFTHAPYYKLYEKNKIISPVQIGNAVLNDATDQLGMVEYAWSHAIISDELYSAVRRECDSFKEEADGGRPGKGCSPALRAFLGAYDDIDIYSIYTPTCLLPAGAGAATRRRPAARLVAAPRLFSKHVRVVLRTRRDRTSS